MKRGKPDRQRLRCNAPMCRKLVDGEKKKRTDGEEKPGRWGGKTGQMGRKNQADGEEKPGN